MDRKQTRASCEYIWQSLIYKHLKRFILVSSPRHATITFNRLINVAYHPSDFCRLSQSLYIFSTSRITDRNQCVISMNEFRLFHCFIETVSPFVLRDILQCRRRCFLCTMPSHILHLYPQFSIMYQIFPKNTLSQ